MYERRAIMFSRKQNLNSTKAMKCKYRGNEMLYAHEFVPCANIIDEQNVCMLASVSWDYLRMILIIWHRIAWYSVLFWCSSVRNALNKHSENQRSDQVQNSIDKYKMYNNCMKILRLLSIELNKWCKIFHWKCKIKFPNNFFKNKRQL